MVSPYGRAPVYNKGGSLYRQFSKNIQLDSWMSPAIYNLYLSVSNIYFTLRHSFGDFFVLLLSCSPRPKKNKIVRRSTTSCPTMLKIELK